MSMPRRPIRALRARLHGTRQGVLHRAELRRGRGRRPHAGRAPIFILGAPRSGTTLLYQLLVEGLDVGWLANAHLRSPSDVSRIERRERPRAARAASTWTSRHGATDAPWEPAEAGAFWYRFFPRRPHELSSADATPARVAALRAAVREFADACGAPVVFKNVFNSLRVPVLAAAFDEARFIVIHRDLLENARSLLAGRVSRGDVDAWWSAEPAGSEGVREASASVQVTWQVQRMQQVAAEQLDAHAPGRYLHVSYDELCADPRALLTRIHAWLVRGGVDVSMREDADVPATFRHSSGGILAEELEEQLRRAVADAGHVSRGVV